jgi:spore coat polysaccharide biosynthesis predicted glycosyltransferase SpsG
MRFVIRADASPKIGAGHVMRCCAIAEELIDKGQKVVFVGETKSLPWVQERVRTLGFSEIYRDTEYFRSDPKSDVLILDSYEVDPGDSFISAANWRRVVAIVDDATPQVHADLYIHIQALKRHGFHHRRRGKSDSFRGLNTYLLENRFEVQGFNLPPTQN